MDNIKYCHLCLMLNVKLSRMTTPTLEAYSRLLRLPLCNDEPYICYECSGLLLKYQQFHSKCVWAHDVLSHLKLHHQQVTEKALDVTSKLYKLKSKLSQSLICNEELDPQWDSNNEEEFSLTLKVESVDFQDNDHDVDNNKEHLHDDVTISEVTKPIEYVNCLHEPFDDNNPMKYDQIAQTERSKVKLEIQNVKPKEGKDILSQEDNEIEDTSVSDISNKPSAYKPLKKHPKELPENTIKKGTKRKRKTAPNEEKESDFDERLSKKSTASRNDRKNLAKHSEVVHGDITLVKKGEFDASFCEGYVEVVLMTPEEAKKEVLLRKQNKNYITSPYKCDFCYRGFMSKTTFDNHIKKHSQTRGSLQCHYCLMRYPKNRLLLNHINASHIRKFKCLKCEHVCFKVCQVKAHIKAHKGSTYSCKECGKEFSLHNSLLNHKRQKHPKECVCALCGSAFGTQHGLYLHQQFAHKQESTAVSGPRCAECTLQFATEAAYRRHLVVSDKHRGAVSNGCDVCGDTFANREELKIHSEVHGKKRKLSSVCCALPVGFPAPPAECPLCDQWLSTVNEAKAHVTSQHAHSDIANKISAAKTCQEKKMYACDYCREQIISKRSSTRITSETLANAPHVSETPSKPGSVEKVARESTAVSGLRCAECALQFATKADYRRHLVISDKHKGAVSNGCDVCGDTFANREELRIHSEVHGKKRKLTSVCCALPVGFPAPPAECPLESTAVSGLRCAECALQFATKADYRRHLVISDKHKGAVSNGCDVCGDTFANREELRIHSEVHGKKRKLTSVCCALPVGFPAPPAECPLCDQWLSTVNEAKAHVTSQHAHSDIANKISAAKTCQEKKMYACDYCREQIISKRSSTRITSETRENAPHVSETPSKPGSVARSARSAGSRSKGKSDPYVCEVCGEKVARRRTLKYHILKHTGERPLKCGECGKGFMTPSTLCHHRASHDPRRAFQCHACPRAFKRKNTMETHLKRAHSDVRPYQCDICSKRFLQQCEVRQHVRCMHEKVPWPSKKTRKQAADEDSER